MNLLAILSPIFWGLLVLSLLVFVHEAGHYGMARLCGVRVTEFFWACRSGISFLTRARNTVLRLE